MRFKVSGTQHSTSARTVIEIEAPNRAAAEKQAQRQGIDILRVQEVRDDPLEGEMPHHPQSHRGEFEEDQSAKWKVTIVLIAIAVVAVAIFVIFRMRAA